MTEYLKYYNLERYLFEEVGPRFRADGVLEPLDLFMILIWKSNCAKTKIRKKLKAEGSFEAAIKHIARSLFEERGRKERMAILVRERGLSLPMASAILTVLYPDEFTIFDFRVCAEVGLRNSYSSKFDTCWEQYEEFQAAVCRKAPAHLSLRDKDRYLWGKSFYKDAKKAAKQ